MKKILIFIIHWCQKRLKFKVLFDLFWVLFLMNKALVRIGIKIKGG